MKIIRKNEREELVKEIPFEIRYEAFSPNRIQLLNLSSGGTPVLR